MGDLSFYGGTWELLRNHDFERVSSVHFQAVMIKKLYTSITISESQFVIMVMFSLMIKKKVNWTVSLTWTVVLIHLHMAK